MTIRIDASERTGFARNRWVWVGLLAVAAALCLVLVVRRGSSRDGERPQEVVKIARLPTQRPDDRVEAMDRAFRQADGMIRVAWDAGESGDEGLNYLYDYLHWLLTDPDLSESDFSRLLEKVLARGDKESRAQRLPPEFGAMVLARVAGRNPVHAWEVFHQRYWEKRASRPFSLALGDIGEQMARSDLSGTVTLASDAETPVEMTARVLEVYLEKDSEAALAWMNERTVGRNSMYVDRLAGACGRRFAETGEFAEAWEMAKRIEDSKERREIEGFVWSRERDQLRAETGADPEATVGGIVEGRSAFADYWLEEAMFTWVERDFDSASRWYEENWSALPEEKAQYVAAAFATQSLQQGAFGTARQWAESILDAKTKARIEAAISRAERE